MPVIQWARKTGDYSVLSHPDLCVLALTYLLNEEDKNRKEKEQSETVVPTASKSCSLWHSTNVMISRQKRRTMPLQKVCWTRKLKQQR